MSRTIGITVLLGCCFTVAYAEDPYDVLWTRFLGTPSWDLANDVAIDGLGNAYLVGDTDGSLSGTSHGQTDAFAAKFDPDGNELWRLQTGTADNDGHNRLSIDVAGDIFIAGFSQQTNESTLDKYDSDGFTLWNHQFGASAAEVAEDTVAASDGSVYVTGLTFGDTGGPNAGGFDAYLLKFDGDGILVWSRQLGTTHFDTGEGLAVDSDDNVYVTGMTQGELGGSNNGAGDAFLAKFDELGGLSWVRQLGTTANEHAHDVAVGPSGDVYVTGKTGGDLGDPNAGSADAFLARYNPLGTLLWVRQLGSTSSDESLAVAVDGREHIYIAGWTDGNLDGSVTEGDGFVAKYNRAGTLIWVKQVSTPAYDGFNGIAVDDSGAAVYIGGQDLETGGGDAMLVKIGLPDTDGDGLLDTWETDGIPYTGDGGAEMHYMLPGADPQHKDLYVEVDAMQGMALSTGAVLELEDAFSGAPLTNPDGNDGINLHILRDSTSLAHIPVWNTGNSCMPTTFFTVRDSNFGTSAELADQNSTNLLNAKALAYRYAIVADRSGPASWGGCGQTPGDNFVIFIGNRNPIHAEAAVFMHELGHNLGLRHGGGDKINGKTNYPSIMNYVLSYRLSWNETFWMMDYSRADSGGFVVLDESALNEFAGIGGPASYYKDYWMPFGVTGGDGTTRLVKYAKLNGSRTDFGSTDGSMTQDSSFDVGVVQDLNYAVNPPPGIRLPAGLSPGQTFEPYNDWANVRLGLVAAAGAGSAIVGYPEDELSEEARDWIDANFPLPPSSDLFGDGFESGDVSMWSSSTP